LNGLAAAQTTFEWSAGGEFFESFGNPDVLGAELHVSVRAQKSGSFTGIECRAFGTVTVPCDRCFDPLDLAFDCSFALSVKFGPEFGRTDAEDREIVMLPYGEADLDLAQFVYDYVWTSLPMQRVHPEGECNEEAMKYLSK